jgi:hypothetical protein
MAPASTPLAPSLIAPKWLLHLLLTILDVQRAPVLMTRRIWHAHNELTHDKPFPSIEGSHRFLV